jgi:hypothetical protein
MDSFFFSSDVFADVKRDVRAFSVEQLIVGFLPQLEPFFAFLPADFCALCMIGNKGRCGPQVHNASR